MKITEISVILATLVTFIGTTIKLYDYIKKGLKCTLNEEFKSINDKIDKINAKIDDNTLNQDKNFLVACFDEIDQGKTLSETTIERIYECMEEYTNLGGNSFVHSRFEKLKKDGKL